MFCWRDGTPSRVSFSFLCSNAKEAIFLKPIVNSVISLLSYEYFTSLKDTFCRF